MLTAIFCLDAKKAEEMKEYLSDEWELVGTYDNLEDLQRDASSGKVEVVFVYDYDSVKKDELRKLWRGQAVKVVSMAEQKKLDATKPKPPQKKPEFKIKGGPYVEVE